MKQNENLMPYFTFSTVPNSLYVQNRLVPLMFGKVIYNHCLTYSKILDSQCIYNHIVTVSNGNFSTQILGRPKV